MAERMFVGYAVDVIERIGLVATTGATARAAATGLLLFCRERDLISQDAAETIALLLMRPRVKSGEVTFALEEAAAELAEAEGHDNLYLFQVHSPSEVRASEEPPFRVKTKRRRRR